MPFDWVPLLAAIAGYNRRGVVMTQSDRLDVVPWSGAIAGCHCWMPFDRVPLQDAIGGGWLGHTLTGRGAIALYHGQVPLLGAIAGGGECTRWRIGRAI